MGIHDFQNIPEHSRVFQNILGVAQHLDDLIHLVNLLSEDRHVLYQKYCFRNLLIMGIHDFQNIPEHSRLFQNILGVAPHLDDLIHLVDLISHDKSISIVSLSRA